jgi:cation/acetate symporter
MDLQTTIYLVVGASFALYIGIAIWARAGSTSEFYAAGGSVPPVMNGMATAADWMSAASFISMAGLIANMGYGGGLFLMGWTGGYVLLAMLLAPYLRKFGKFTVPQFIGDRFYSKSASTVAVLCLLTASLTYIIGQMTGVGVAFSRFLACRAKPASTSAMAIVFAVRRVRRHEGHHLHPGRPVHRADLRLHRSGRLHLDEPDRQPDPATGSGLEHVGFRCRAADPPRHRW